MVREGMTLRVVIVSDFANVSGGAARIAVESARALAEAGCEIVFIAAIGPVSDRLHHSSIRVELLDLAEVWGVANPLKAASQGIWNGHARAAVAQILAREAGPDTLVHLHQWTKAFSPAAIDAAGASALPVVVTVHDYFSFCPEGCYFDFRAGEPCRRRPMSAACMGANCDRRSYPHKLVRVARQLRSDRAMSGVSDLTFVHVSEFARRFATPFLPAHAAHATVENIVDAPRHPPADVAANRHLLYLGRFTQEKGVVELARAAAEVALPVRFVGEGPLADAIRVANPQADVRGWVAPDAVHAEIAQARALVAPSRWFEPGPLVVAEAKAAGVPAVVSRDTGAASWIADGVDGLLTDPDDPGSLRAVLETLKHGDIVSSMGVAAHASYWNDPLTPARHASGLVALYRRIVAERHNRLHGNGKSRQTG